MYRATSIAMKINILKSNMGVCNQLTSQISLELGALILKALCGDSNNYHVEFTLG